MDTAAASPELDCAHCGLPLGRRPVAATIDARLERFCCYGCALARQITRASGERGAAASALVRLGLAIFFAMNAMMVSLPTYVPAVYGEQAFPTDGPLFQALRVLALIFSTPVLLLLGGPIVVGAYRGMRLGAANTDALIVLGTAAAYGLSAVHVFAGRSDVYFDTVVMLLVLVTIGRYLEARARADAGEAISRTLTGGPGPILRLARLGDARGLRVPAEALGLGDLVRVTAGETFPADGVVVDGSGGVDQSVLTGEHRACLLAPGDRVAGGSSSIDGVFTVRITARAADSTVARIEKMLAEARRARTPSQMLADRISNAMLPILLAVAVTSGVYWTLHADADRGVLAALAVLCVACPCGLGIATPVALWTSLRQAARHGIAVRDPAALERLARVRLIFFDKTGTLTERTPRLEAIEAEAAAGWAEERILAVAAAVERGQLHPLARGIEAAASLELEGRRAVAQGGSSVAERDRSLDVADVRVLPGLGVSALVDGVRTTVGSLSFAAAELGGHWSASDRPDTTEVAVWQEGHLLGRLRLRERARAEASEALGALRGMGFRLHLLTGDTQASAVVPFLIAGDEATVGLTPERKLEELRRARQSGAVAMVGDGINDGPALAAADVGVAVCAATDLARTTAAVALMTDDLGTLPWLASLARRTEAIIRQNLLWVFAYNGVAVALAATGHLSPIVATLAMIGSSLLVVANSRRLDEPAPRSTTTAAFAAVGRSET